MMFLENFWSLVSHTFEVSNKHRTKVVELKPPTDVPNSSRFRLQDEVLDFRRYRPDFDDLPLKPSHPQGSSWGLWGDNDELGTLNFLTLDIVYAASREVLSGKVIPLK